MSKENVILIDYDAPNDWEFHKAIEQLLITQFIIRQHIKTPSITSIVTFKNQQ